MRERMIEKTVAKLPQTHREAGRLAYVFRCTPAIAIRELALSCEGLACHVRDGRTMVKNLSFDMGTDRFGKC